MGAGGKPDCMCVWCREAAFQTEIRTHEGQAVLWAEKCPPKISVEALIPRSSDMMVLHGNRVVVDAIS